MHYFSQFPSQSSVMADILSHPFVDLVLSVLLIRHHKVLDSSFGLAIGGIKFPGFISNENHFLGETMSQENPSKDEQSFMYLVGTFQSSAWIAMGKMKNPMTDKIERNLDQASFYIDLLDMMQTKTKGNLSEYEEQMLINTVSELKMNFIEEKKKPDDPVEEKDAEENKSEEKEPVSEDKSGEEE